MTGILLKGRYKYYAGTHPVSSQYCILIYSFKYFCGPAFHEVLAYCNRRPEKKLKTNWFFFFCLKMFRPCSRLWDHCSETFCKIFCQQNMKDVFLKKKKKHCLVSAWPVRACHGKYITKGSKHMVYKERAASKCRIVHLKTSKKDEYGN